MAKASDSDWDLGIEKLESSGLTIDDAKKLRIQVLSGEETAALSKSFKALPALRLNYYDPRDPQKLLSGWPGWPGFYRIRYLKKSMDFSDATKGKSIRYAQPFESGVCAYFPTTVNWPDIIDNVNEPILITEGELKAAKACKEGFNCIGLGGVYNFKSAKLGIMFLPELECIDWAKRHVYVIYDSDFRTNQNVCNAITALSEELMARGAIPYTVPLPDMSEGVKTGLDDYLVANSAQHLQGLLHEHAVPLTLARPLWKLNNEVVYVRNPGLIIDQKTAQKLGPTAFTQHAFSPLDYAEQMIRPDGTIGLKKSNAAQAWLKWPLRNEVNRITYEPGQERFIEDPEYPGHMAWNAWPGWGATPKKGNVDPFLDLLDHLFTGARKGSKEWFIKWLAYPLQYPGTKLFTSAVFYGIKHGTGKSLIGYTMGKIYGRNYTEISQGSLHASFNEWAESRQFVLGDDVTGSNKRQEADLLKKLITQNELRVNMKFVPSYVVPDCINYYFTSNQPDAFFLEDNDRRFFIHEVQVDPLDESFYADYDLWISGFGASYLFDYLLNIDVSDFNPTAAAFITDAKIRMIDDVRSDLGMWIRQVRDDPKNMLTVGSMNFYRDLMTTQELLTIYDVDGKTKTTANGLGRELRRAGVPMFKEGMPLKTNLGQNRYYILGNYDKWSTASALEARAYLDKPKAEKPKKKF